MIANGGGRSSAPVVSLSLDVSRRVFGPLLGFWSGHKTRLTVVPQNKKRLCFVLSALSKSDKVLLPFLPLQLLLWLFLNLLILLRCLLHQGLFHEVGAMLSKVQDRPIALS